jgi:hypothetical protein
MPCIVIPAEAGTQESLFSLIKNLDPGFRRGDGSKRHKETHQ